MKRTTAIAITLLALAGCDSFGLLVLRDNPNAPEAVDNLSVTAVTSTSVTLEWSQVASGTTTEADYLLRYGSPGISWEAANGTEVVVPGTAAGGDLSYTYTGLAAGTAHEFQAVAFREPTVNEVALELTTAGVVIGPLSNVASASTLPASGVTAGVASAVGSAGRISLSATAASGGTQPYTYQWYRSTTSGFTPGPATALAGFNSRNEVDTGVTSGTRYYYVLVVTDADGVSAASNQVNAMPSSGVLTAGDAFAVGGSGRVSLSATPATDGATPYAYQWHRSTASGFTPGPGSALTGLNSLNEVDTGVTNGTTYYYVLVVTDAGGASADYGEVAATPQAASVGHPNEPAGFTQIADNPFDVEVPSGWVGYRVGNLSIQSDATAPRSPSNIGAVLFPGGYVGGSGPINLESPTFNSRELYMHFWFKVSANWDGHSSGVNKIIFVSNNNHDDIYLAAVGSGSGPLHLQVRSQNVVGGSQNYRPNVGNGGIARDTWYNIEVLLRLDSSAGAGDGQIDVWMNGTKTHQHTGVNLVRSGDDNTLNYIFWNPTYGGGNADSVPSDQYQYIDQIYLSGD